MGLENCLLAIQKSIRMDEECITKVIYEQETTKHIWRGSRADAYEDGCLADRVGGYRDLGIFWAARNTQQTQHTDRIDAERFSREYRV